MKPDILVHYSRTWESSSHDNNSDFSQLTNFELCLWNIKRDYLQNSFRKDCAFLINKN